MHTVSVGDDIESVYNPGSEYLGVTLGDGTFLEGVRQFGSREIPILGVNAGSLAFLASNAPNELIDALDEVIQGKTSGDERQQIRVQADGVDCAGSNDVMIEHVPPGDPVERKITRLQVFADSEFISEYEGNGVAVSTPTGSMGVSLSGNGPIHYRRRRGLPTELLSNSGFHAFFAVRCLTR